MWTDRSMPNENASARSNGTIGSTVNERRMASRKGTREIWSRSFSNLETTNAAVAELLSARHSSPSRVAAGFHCDASSKLSMSPRSAFSLVIRLSFQVLDQQFVTGVHPGNLSSAECNPRSGPAYDNRALL